MCLFIRNPTWPSYDFFCCFDVQLMTILSSEKVSFRDGDSEVVIDVLHRSFSTRDMNLSTNFILYYPDKIILQMTTFFVACA